MSLRAPGIFRAGRKALHPATISKILRGTNPIGRHNSLSGGATLDARLTCSPHIEQVRKWAAQTMGMPGTLLNRKNDLSVRNVVLLYKQVIRTMMDYACHAWRSAVRTHVRRLWLLQSFAQPLVPLLLKQQADTQGSGCSLVCRPHQSADLEL